MRFSQIPEEAKEARPWLTHRPIGPPADDEKGTIGTLDALVGIEEDPDYGHHPVIRFCAEIEEGDIERLQNGEKVWIEIWTNTMYPISVSVGAT